MIVLRLHCCAQAFSSCSEQGLLSSYTARASHCSGFSCWGTRAPGHVGFRTQAWYLRCTDLVALQHVDPEPGVEPVSLPWQEDS